MNLSARLPDRFGASFETPAARAPQDEVFDNAIIGFTSS
jgi:hypothetical protein